MTERLSLTNQFLIAMPALADPNFHGTVTYICEHNDQGAMGIVINRPLNLTLGEVLDQMQIATEQEDIGRQTVYMGGPVQTDRGFVLHNPVGAWDSMLRIHDELGVTTSKDILEDIATGTGPKHILVALGYAGWGAGQLEQELADNVWLCGPADQRIMFDIPWQQRWEAAAALMGVDLNQISNQIGHA
ncbi:MAG: YqgE/AlgH family protein [Gammaproteobacteria bacterium]|jgi:putative transcriptional regulator